MGSFPPSPAPWAHQGDAPPHTRAGSLPLAHPDPPFPEGPDPWDLLGYRVGMVGSFLPPCRGAAPQTPVWLAATAPNLFAASAPLWAALIPIAIETNHAATRIWPIPSWREGKLRLEWRKNLSKGFLLGGCKGWCVADLCLVGGEEGPEPKRPLPGMGAESEAANEVRGGQGAGRG